MKYPSRKKSSRSTKPNKRAKLSNKDSFFEPDKSRTRFNKDEDIESEDEELFENGYGGNENEDDEAQEVETAEEVKLRIAKEHLQKIKELAKRVEEDEDDDEDENEDGLIGDILKNKQLEDSGRARRFIAQRVLSSEPTDEFRLLVKHRQPVTSIALSEDDTRGFSASKDGVILHWDVEVGKTEKYLWPSEDVLISHHAKASQNSSTKRSKHVLALAVSSDGRYLASGGLDRHVHLWDTRTRQHIQAFHGHKGPVSCLAFRQGTTQLFSGSYDRQIKLWNAEDRTHIDTLHGHQSEIVSIDCLQKERILTAGRDRTIQLWKVADEKRLLYRSPTSADCCCFISDNEFLSGSDDGSIELWHALKKKPIFIVKNAHGSDSCLGDQIDKEKDIRHTVQAGNGYSLAQSWVSSVTVCRNSDLAASGAANGVVNIWRLLSDDKKIQHLFKYPLEGYVNSLAFAKSGRFLLAGVGQEPRLGKWDRIKSAQNGVAIHPIRLKEDQSARLLRD